MKKLFCIALSLMLFAAFLAVPAVADVAYEAYIGSVGYETFADAINAANESTEDVVTIDVASDFYYKGEGKPYKLTHSTVIDFHGFTFTLDGNQAIRSDNNTSGTPVDVTVKNGTILLNFITNESHFVFGAYGSKTTFTVKDFTVNMNTMVPYGSASFLAMAGKMSLDGVTYNYLRPETGSSGAILGSRCAAGVFVKNSVFNCDYKVYAYYYTNTSFKISVENSTFNKIDRINEAVPGSKITDTEQIVAEHNKLNRNEYETGFSIDCQHNYAGEETCAYCGNKNEYYGDVNSDKTVDIKDLLALKKFIAKWNVTVDEPKSDVNDDDKISLKDILKIKKYIVGIVTRIEPDAKVENDDGKELKIINFNYATPSAVGTVGSDHAILILPKDYEKDGAPTRLAIDLHGYSVAIDDRSTLSRYQYVTTLAHEGFAVLQAQALGIGHCGASSAVEAYINAYKFVIDKYNLKEEVFVNGNSMGGLTSINLVSSEEIPIIAHSLHYPICSTYRQTYNHGWINSLRKSLAYYNNFSYDKYNEDNGTSYTYNTFPFTSPLEKGTDAELELFSNNFFDKVATKYSIYAHTNILNSTKNGFAPDFEGFLTEFDPDKVEEMYSKIVIDYPTPVFIQQCEKDSDRMPWSQKFADAINKGSGEKATWKWFPGSKHGGAIGPEMTFTAKDGTELTVFESAYNIAKYYESFE